MGIVQKASFRLTIVSYLGAALGYFNKVLLFTNFLLPNQVGLINIFTIVSMYYAQFAALGMTSISVRFFPYFQQKDKHHHGFLFWGNVVITLGFLLVTILFICLKPLVIHFYIKDSPLLVDFYYYNIPLALGLLYFQFLESYLRALLKTVVATFVYEFLGRIMVTISITFYALKIIDFHQFVIIYVLSNTILALILLVYVAYLKQLFIMPVKSKRLNRLVKIIVVYGLYTIMGALGGSILGSVDSLIVTAKLNLAQGGIYTTVALIATVMSLPFRSIVKISHPVLARYWKEKNMSGMLELYQKTSLIDMVLGGFLFLGIWVNVDSIFRFVPKEYYTAKYALLFLIIAKYIDMATGLNGYIIITSKKFRYDLWFMLFLVIITVAMNLIFIPIYGITGAAFASLICIALYNILRLLFVYYSYNMQPFTLDCLWVLLITIIVWAITIQIPHLHNKYFDIILKSAVVSLLYGGAILYFRLSSDVNNLVYSYTKIRFFAPREKL